jgi:tetratricopeptide (TPR) repeat protein
MKALEGLETREPALAAQLHMSAGTTFYQWSQNFKANGRKDEAVILRDPAIRALEKAWILDPQSADLAYVLGVVMYNEGKKKEASEFFKKCLSINPAHDLAVKFMQERKIK